jgi:hypothetical protein
VRTAYPVGPDAVAGERLHSGWPQAQAADASAPAVLACSRQASLQ